MDIKPKKEDISKNFQEVESNESIKKCGIVMPIAAMEGYPESHWKDVKSILVSAIDEVNFEAKMVNEADDIGVIHKRIVQNLYDNPMIVCDISGRNPNVMFELGLRLAFDKPTIIVKDEVTPYSFDTSSIEHLTYPKDLRYHKIEVFKEELKDRIEKTYKAYEIDPENYSTFLKSYGDFKTPIINEQTVPLDQYMLDEIKGLRLTVNQLSRSLNKSDELDLRRKNHNLSFKNDHILTLINHTKRNIDELYMQLSNLLDSSKITVIKASDESIQVIDQKNNAPFNFFTRYVENNILSSGYKMSPIEENLYLIMEETLI